MKQSLLNRLKPKQESIMMKPDKSPIPRELMREMVNEARGRYGHYIRPCGRGWKTGLRFTVQGFSVSFKQYPSEGIVTFWFDTPDGSTHVIKREFIPN
jgi:hypothetical protein